VTITEQSGAEAAQTRAATLAEPSCGTRGEPRGQPAPTPTPERDRPARRRADWASLLVALVALSPFLVGAVQIVRRGFPPGALFGDRAILALTGIDAFHAPVLLGPYSRFYWHHPGPLYFYVLQVWSWAFGRSTVALVLGAVAVDVAGAVGILVLAHRRGGRPLLVWTSLLLTAYLVALDPVPFDIWNPSVTVLPFVAMLLLAWSVACRDWWAMPWLAFVASFVVQTHVGLAPGAAAAIGGCAVIGWTRVRRSATPLAASERRTVGRAALVAVVVGLVAWLPPIVQELTGREGNLSALVQFFTKPTTPHSLADGLNTAALQATLMLRSVIGPVTLRDDLHQGLTLALLITALAFGAGLVLARRARSSDTLALMALVVVELVVGVYAVTRIAGDIQFYLVQWISAVGFVLWVACGHAVVAFVRTRAPAAGAERSALPLMRVAGAIVLVALCVSTIRAFPGNAGLVNEDLDVPNNRALFGYVPAKQLLAATREGGTVVLRPESRTSWEVLAADALMLEQHGRHVRIIATQETRLLFDDALLVDGAHGLPVLAFRDRRQPRRPVGATFVADQGRWSVIAIDRG